MTRRSAGFFVPPRHDGKDDGDGQYLVSIGAVDRAGVRRGLGLAVDHHLGGLVRDRGRRHRRQHHRPAADAVDQLHRRRRRRGADVSRRHRHRSARGQAQFRLERHHRADGVLCALSRLPAAGPLRARLAVAAGADRRNIALHHVGRGGLRGDGRDRLQPHRARQDHPRRLLHQRHRHRAGARPDLRQLRFISAAVRCRHRCRGRGAAVHRPLAVQEDRRPRQRARDKISVPGAVRARRPRQSRKERSGAAGLSDRHGAGAVLHGQSRAAASPARDLLCLPHAVLLSQSGFADRMARACRRPRADRRLPGDEDVHQIRRHFAADALFQLHSARGHVHDLDDVDRADLRLDLGACSG